MCYLSLPDGAVIVQLSLGLTLQLQRLRAELPAAVWLYLAEMGGGSGNTRKIFASGKKSWKGGCGRRVPC